MGLFRKTPRPVHAERKPTLRERRAAQQTARAEARLLETEQRIHQIADEVRSDIRSSGS
jgi:predicted transposase YdaD